MPPAAIFGLPEWAGRLTLAGLVIAAALILLWAIALLVPRVLARSASARDERARQRQTAVAAVATSLRYVVLIAAVIAIAFALAGGGAVAAVSGGALVAIVAGFAGQRLLLDVIAGFFILFEDQYTVGDTIEVEPSGYVGRVESLSLRATVLRDDCGEQMIIPNGQINAVRILLNGRRRWRLELLSSEPERVIEALHALAAPVAGAGGPWQAPPRVTQRPEENGLVRLVAALEVAPGRDQAVTEWLPRALSDRLGDRLEAPPLVLLDPLSG